MSIVLGIPVNELRHRITAHELNEWAAFEKVFGPLTVQERVDVAGGLAAWGSLASMGSKTTPDKLVPEWDERTPPAEQDPEEIVNFMKAFQSKTRKEDR